MRIRLLCKLAGAALALVALLSATAAFADNGAGALVVPGATSTPTHWNIPIGVPTTARICGVTLAEAGDPLPPTLTVWVKSTFMGNTMLVATWVGGDCYEFVYTPPAYANGDFDACGTTIVAYMDIGLNANNDIADDGFDNDSQTAASGFRFVDALGAPIECTVLGADEEPWGTVKRLYR
jgi:hypothetical protein